MYDRSFKMLGSCAVSVVFWPSGAFHVAWKRPPTPVAKGVTTPSLGLLLLNGVPWKPQTTPAVGLIVAPAWMCALVRLSLGSGVCEPVTSMLLMVASIVICDPSALRMNRAVPNDAGRGWPF